MGFRHIPAAAGPGGVPEPPKAPLSYLSFLWNFIVQTFPGTGSGATTVGALQPSEKAGASPGREQSCWVCWKEEQADGDRQREGRKRGIWEGAAPYSSFHLENWSSELLRMGKKGSRGLGREGRRGDVAVAEHTGIKFNIRTCIFK